MGWLQNFAAGFSGNTGPLMQQRQQNFLDEQQWKEHQNLLERIEAEKNAKLGLITGAAEFEDKQLGQNLAALREANPDAFNQYLNAFVGSNAAPAMRGLPVPSKYTGMSPEQLGGMASLFKSGLTQQYGMAGAPASSAANETVVSKNLASQEALGEAAWKAANPDIVNDTRAATLMKNWITPTYHGNFIANPATGSFTSIGQNPFSTEKMTEQTVIGPDGKPMKVPVVTKEQGYRIQRDEIPTQRTASIMADKVAESRSLAAKAKEVADTLDFSNTYGRYSVPPIARAPADVLKDGRKGESANAKPTSLLSKVAKGMESFRDILYNKPSMLAGVEPSSFIGQGLTLASKPITTAAKGLDVLGRMAYDQGPGQIANIASKAGQISSNITSPAVDQQVQGKVINLPGIGPAQRIGTTQEGVILRTEKGTITIPFKKYQELLEKARELPQNP